MRVLSSPYLRCLQTITPLSEHIKFDSLKAEAREEWRSMLGRVEVVDPGDDVDGDWVQTHLTIFYTGLYRALSFPRRLDEVASDAWDDRSAWLRPQHRQDVGPDIHVFDAGTFR